MSDKRDQKRRAMSIAQYRTATRQILSEDHHLLSCLREPYLCLCDKNAMHPPDRNAQKQPCMKSRKIRSVPVQYAFQPSNRLPVALGHTLQLVLLLDGVRVAAALGSVDQLLSKALGNRLDVAEGGLAGTGCQEGNGLVDTTQGRDIDGLSPDGTSRADTGAVFARAAVDNGIDGDLDGVLVGNEVDLRI